jgi:hypothetical membrane protein
MRTPTRVLLAAGVAGPILFVVIFTIAGWLRSDYSAMVSPVSDLGVGENAWIQNANFLLFGILLIAYAIGFRQALAPFVGRRATRSAIVIGTAGLGLFGAVAFPAAPETGLLHFLLGFLVIMVASLGAAFYGARLFRRLPGGRRLARYSTWTGIISVVLFGCTFFVLNPASPLEQAGIGGLVNRILAIIVFAWYAVTGAWLSLRLDCGGATRSAKELTGVPG